jgi:hypothetical protein
MRDPHVREIVGKLKQDIVARSAESRSMAAEARALRGVERHTKQMERRAFGRRTRWVLLAYAWLRARPYAQVERHAVVPVDVWAIKRLLAPLGMEVDTGPLCQWLRGESPGHEAPVRPAESAEEGGRCAASCTS